MIAVQSAVGDVGRKATTELSNFDFNSMAMVNGYPVGASSDGLFLLNTGTTDNDVEFTRSITFATTDFAIKNPKRIRFIYVGIDTDNAFTVSTKVDEGSWRDETVTPAKTGLQRVRVPIGSDGEGRYWTVKVTSVYPFRIDDIKILIYNESTGKVGY